MLLTTRSLTVESTLLDRVESALGRVLVGQFDGLAAHVPCASVRVAVERVRDVGADVIVTFGGGSVIDGGKAVVADLASNGFALPHVALPTTLAGAEFAHYYGVSEEATGGEPQTKRSFARVDVTPTTVILDPELTVATPEAVWAGSGIKAIDHAIEGIIWGSGRPIADVLALVGIRGLTNNLVHSRKRHDLEARLSCQLAAWQCYAAPATTTLGLSHRIGHVLGGTYGVPHSLTSGITLPPVLRLLGQLTPERVRHIDDALNSELPLVLDGTTGPERPHAAGRVRDLVRALGLPSRLRDLGLSRQDASRTAQLVERLYPQESAVAGDRLHTLLEEMW